jgi:hypothetical protein
LIYVPTDIPDFYQNGDMSGGLVYINVGAGIRTKGGYKAAFNNDTDYSLMETNQLIVTDARGGEIRYGFKFFTGNSAAGSGAATK